MSPEERKVDQEPTLNDVMGILKIMNGRFDNVDEQLGDVRRRLGNVESKVDEVQETLEGIVRAVDKDAETIVALDHRVKLLEA